MINTTELMTACFKAKSKQEMWLCRDLARSIADRSPYAWKLYYSGDVAKCLSKRSIKALEIVMRRAEKMEAGFRMVRRKLEFDSDEQPSPTKKKNSKVRASYWSPKVTEEVRSPRKEKGKNVVVKEEAREKGLDELIHQAKATKPVVEGELIKKIYVFGEEVGELSHVNEEPLVRGQVLDD